MFLFAYSVGNTSQCKYFLLLGENWKIIPEEQFFMAKHKQRNPLKYEEEMCIKYNDVPPPALLGITHKENQFSLFYILLAFVLCWVLKRGSNICVIFTKAKNH